MTTRKRNHAAEDVERDGQEGGEREEEGEEEEEERKKEAKAGGGDDVHSEPIYHVPRAIKVNDPRDNSWFHLYLLCLEVEDAERRSFLLALLYRAFVTAAMKASFSLFAQLVATGTVAERLEKEVGYAGGLKVFKEGMFFKIPVNRPPYESLHAAKAAVGREFLAAEWMQTSDVRVVAPLYCVLDYRGYRIGVECHVPVSEFTFHRCWDNTAKGVMTSEQAASVECELAKRLNLAEHEIRAGQRRVWLPFDVEMGLWRNHWILLDLHRLWPPEYSKSSSKRLTNLLRPEFVLRQSRPLNPDELLFRPPPGEATTLDRATRTLLSEAIPNFARGCVLNLSTDVAATVHSAGLNLRHLGLIWAHVQHEESRHVLEVEMMVRSLKRFLSACALTLNAAAAYAALVNKLNCVADLCALVQDFFFRPYAGADERLACTFQLTRPVDTERVAQRLQRRCCLQWGLDGKDAEYVVQVKKMSIFGDHDQLFSYFKRAGLLHDGLPELESDFVSMMGAAEQTRFPGVAGRSFAQARFTHDEMASKLKDLLFDPNAESVSLSRDAGTVRVGETVIPLAANAADAAHPPTVRLKKRPLQGLRIAIEPCLLGGTHAAFEYAEKLGGTDCGSLNFELAKQLERVLSEQGACVLIARGMDGGPLLPVRLFGDLQRLSLPQKQLLVIVKSYAVTTTALWQRYMLDSFDPQKIDTALSECTIHVREAFARCRLLNEFCPDVALSLWIGYTGSKVNPLALYVPGCMERSSLTGASLQEFERLLLSDVARRSFSVAKHIFSRVEAEESLSLACVAESVGEVQGVIRRCNGIDFHSEAIFFRSLRVFKLVRASISIYAQMFRPTFRAHEEMFGEERRAAHLSELSSAMCEGLVASVHNIRPPLPFYCVLGPKSRSKLVGLLSKVLGVRLPQADVFDESVTAALSEFQLRHGLFVSGVLDMETARVVASKLGVGEFVLGVAYCLGETEFFGVPYGSSTSGGVNCVEYVRAVLEQIFPSVHDDARFRDLVYINGLCDTLVAAVERQDELLAGVSLAVRRYGFGDEVRVDAIEAGDFIQYWYSQGEGSYGGHCGIVESVLRDEKGAPCIQLYGAHQSRGRVTTLDSVCLAGKMCFVSRLRPQVVESFRQPPSYERVGTEEGAAPAPAPLQQTVDAAGSPQCDYLTSAPSLYGNAP